MRMDIERLLITGAEGFLGCRAAVYWKDRYEILAVGHKDLEIRDADAVMRYICSRSPHYVLHCAAMSDTGLAEREPELSKQVNVIGAENVARASREIGAKLVYMSSDQVYNGNNEPEPHRETDAIRPRNTYGIHKMMAEERIQSMLPAAVGLRLAWMYDHPESPYCMNRNLLYQLSQAKRTGTPIHVATHDVRGMTDVWTAVKQFEGCLALPGGIYNYGSQNRLNSYETALAAAAYMGVRPADRLVVPEEEWFLPDGRNLSMNLDKAAAYQIIFPDTLEGIHQCLGRYSADR